MLCPRWSAIHITSAVCGCAHPPGSVLGCELEERVGPFARSHSAWDELTCDLGQVLSQLRFTLPRL